jgi:hypothetical protein
VPKKTDAQRELDVLLEEFGCAPITESDFDTLIEVTLGDLRLNEGPTDAVRTAPLLEAAAPRIIVPKKGKVIQEDGTVQLAIMRPCISRGRRLRGLPPVYEAQMLARSAGVFKDWPMFQDHMPPEVQEAMKKRGRSVSELGGRIVESWFDPDFVAEYDGDMGYWKGAVRGKAIPQEPIAAMIERDPDVLHCSINAWPTSAKPKTVQGTKAMAIEGIRPRPIGSVDWVIRGGAGGRVLNEEERAEAVARVVTFLGEHYSSAHAMPTDKTTPDFSKMKAAELREYLKENAPNLLGSLREDETEETAPTGSSSISLAGLTEERLEEIVGDRLDAAMSKVEEGLASQSDRLEERAQEIVTEREGQRQLSERAGKIIEAAVGITSKMRADLRGRYAMLPSGAAQAIQLCESEATDEKPSDKVLEEMLEADIEHMQEIVREAQGKPPVRNQGGASGDGRSGATTRTEVPYWRRMAVAEGVLEKPEEAVQMFGEGGDD